MEHPYSELYLDDTNELMQWTFDEIVDVGEYDFKHFVDGFMNSVYRERLDKGYPRIMNMPYDELLAYLHRDTPEIFVPGKYDIDRYQAQWIGIMYNMLQFRTNLRSKDIYAAYPLERMQKVFVPLHTVDEEVALDKLVPSVIREVNRIKSEKQAQQ